MGVVAEGVVKGLSIITQLCRLMHGSALRFCYAMYACEAHLYIFPCILYRFQGYLQSGTGFVNSPVQMMRLVHITFYNCIKMDC